MKVLITAYESAPFYKRGGLGDVMESLPKALPKVGVDVKSVIPYYNEIKKKYRFEREGEFSFEFKGKKEHVGVYPSVYPDTKVSIYFLQNENYLSLSKTKDKTKRMCQFAFFNLAVVNFIHYLSEHHKWTVDIIHCNDWHTALIPLILEQKKITIPTLLTIHNLLYQGVGSLKVLELLNIKNEVPRELEKGVPINEMNILGEGIIHATYVSTVSPSYAEEIASGYNKNPISEFLKKREERYSKTDGKIVGILNGIGYDIWNPTKDEIIFHKFDADTWEVGKKNNKEDLLKALGLQDKPTFCFIGRMASQKGLDILINAINQRFNLDINLIILGSGDPRIQKAVSEVDRKYSWVKAEFGYSEELAHKIYAGSDFIVIPSRYEPCGLIQMIAMKYGTIPIASRTGGLKDSILDGKDGILFKKGKSVRLRKAIKRAFNIQKDKDRYLRMVHRAMRKDFSWDKSAILYKRLYRRMLNGK